jgi:hypothetical protein
MSILPSLILCHLLRQTLSTLFVFSITPDRFQNETAHDEHRQCTLQVLLPSKMSLSGYFARDRLNCA